MDVVPPGAAESNAVDPPWVIVGDLVLQLAPVVYLALGVRRAYDQPGWR